MNRAHWPTKENSEIFVSFRFFRPTQKIGPDGPKWAQEYFFPTNPDLADIFGRTDFDFENFYFLDFLGSQLGRSQLGPGPDLKNLARLSAPRIPAGG